MRSRRSRERGNSEKTANGKTATHAFVFWGRGPAAGCICSLAIRAGLRADEEYRLRIEGSKPMFTFRGGAFDIKKRMRVRNDRGQVRTDWQPVWWQLPADLQAGEYYVGAECVQEDAWDDCPALDWVYHNGERFHFSRWTAPVSEPNKLWSATAFSRTPRTF